MPNLISFVGTTDHKELPNNTGPILQALRYLGKQGSVDRVVLIATKDEFEDYSNELKKAIRKAKLATKIDVELVELKDPTDHNEIYPKLKALCGSLAMKPDEWTAAISSGTPSMQVCWVLLSESGEVPLKLIRTIEEKFAAPHVREVKLDTTLPRIKKLEATAKEFEKHFPELTINLSNASIFVGEINLELSPVLFMYYYFFLSQCKQETGDVFVRFSGDVTPILFLDFLSDAIDTCFPNQSNKLKKTLEDSGIAMETFRGNFSKLNKAIRSKISNEVAERISVKSRGARNAKLYGVDIPSIRIQIIE